MGQKNIILAITLIFLVGVGGYLLWSRNSSINTQPTNNVISTPKTSNTGTNNTNTQSNRVSYSNTRYHYQLDYGPSDRLVDGSDTVAIVIDPKADPVAICAADNNSHWSSEQLFTNWKDNPPQFSSTPEPTFSYCTDYPNYAQIATSTTKIGNLSAYTVTSLRGQYKTICTYIANKQTLLAVCLPAEDPGDGNWDDHYAEYQKIISSIQIAD